MSAIRSSASKGVETISFSYAEWRQRFLNLILRSACIVGLLVTIAASLDVPMFLAGIYISAYITVLILTFAPVPYRFRAGGFLLVVYALAISGLLENGIRVDASLLLMTMTIMATMLFSTRSGIIAIGISIGTFAVAGFFILTGHYTLINQTSPSGTLAEWIVATLVLLLLETVIVTGLIQLQRGFNLALRQAQHLFGVVAAERASLEQRVEARTAQIRTSADVGRAAASILNTNDLLHEVVNLITERFGFYYTAIFTLDDTRRWAVLREATGEAGRILKEQTHQLEIGGQSMVGTAIQTRAPRIALDVGAEAVRFANPLLPDSRSEIALPLIVGDRVLGALDVQSTLIAAFDETNAAALQAMADQIAIALSNAEQFKQTEATLQSTQNLFAASQELSLATDADTILRSLIRHIAAGASRAGLMLMGPRDETNRLAYVEYIATWVHADYSVVAEPLRPGARFSPQQMPLVDYIASGQPLIVADANAAEVAPAMRTLMHRFGAEAMMALPLVAGRNLLGAVVIGYRQPRPFDAAEVQTLITLSSQAAIVLQNQRSLAETQAALKQLDLINRRLTGAAWSTFTAPLGGALRVQAIAPDVAPEAAAAGISAPIVVRGEPIGRLKLHDVQLDREWNETDRALIEAVANEVAVAIDNARLLEQTERRAQRERLIADISRKMQAAGDLHRIARIAGDELGRALHVTRTAVRIGADATDPSITPNGLVDDDGGITL